MKSLETGFHYESEKSGYAQRYLEPEIIQLLGPGKKKILDIGCGDVAMAAVLSQQGHEVWGCDWDQPGAYLASHSNHGWNQ